MSSINGAKAFESLLKRVSDHVDEHISRKLTASMKDLNHDGNKELILGFLINKKYHVTGIYYYQPKKGAIPYQLFKKADSYKDTIVTDQNHVIIVNKRIKELFMICRQIH